MDLFDICRNCNAHTSLFASIVAHPFNGDVHQSMYTHIYEADTKRKRPKLVNDREKKFQIKSKLNKEASRETVSTL